jgi:hypothetical protein
MPAFDARNEDHMAQMRQLWINGMAPHIRRMVMAIREWSRGPEPWWPPNATFDDFFMLMGYYFFNMREYLTHKGWAPTEYLAHRTAAAIIGAAWIALHSPEKWPEQMERATRYKLLDLTPSILWILQHYTPRRFRWWTYVMRGKILYSVQHCHLLIQKDPITESILTIEHHHYRRNNNNRRRRIGTINGTHHHDDDDDYGGTGNNSSNDEKMGPRDPTWNDTTADHWN